MEKRKEGERREGRGREGKGERERKGREESSQTHKALYAIIHQLWALQLMLFIISLSVSQYSVKGVQLRVCSFLALYYLDYTVCFCHIGHQ